MGDKKIDCAVAFGDDSYTVLPEPDFDWPVEASNSVVSDAEPASMCP